MRHCLAALLLLSACDSDDPPAIDAGRDAGRDAGPDTAAEVSAEAGRESSADTSSDASEASVDASDVHENDAPADAGDGPKAPGVDAPTITVADVKCEQGMVVFPHMAELSDYSRQLDRVIVASAFHRALWIVDPAACSGRTVTLPRAAVSLSVFDEGRQVMVGLDGSMVPVDLRTGALGRRLPVPVTTSATIVDARGKIHATGPQLVSLDPDTGQTSLSAFYAGGALIPHPNGRLIYMPTDRDVVQLDLSTGVPSRLPSESNTGVPLNTCGMFHVSDDGQRAFTGCGSILRLTGPGQPENLTVIGSWQVVGGAGFMHSSGARMVKLPGPFMNDRQHQVTWHDSKTGALLKTFELPYLLGQQRGQARRAYVRADGARVHILIWTHGMYWERHALLSLAEDGPTVPPPLPDAGAPQEPPTPYGVQADLPGLPKLEPARGSERQLGFQTTAATYSHRHKLLIAAAGPPTPAVHLFDPDASDRVVPVRAQVRSLHLSPDQSLVAATHADGVSIIDIGAAAVQRTATVPQTQHATFKNAGEVWLVAGTPGNRQLVPVNVQTGVVGPAVLGSWLVTPIESLTFHPDGQRAYGIGDSVARYQPTEPLAASKRATPAHGEPCQALWVPGPAHLLTDCGPVMALDPDASRDLNYAGSLEGMLLTLQVDALPGTDQILALGGALVGRSVRSALTRELRVYGPPHWSILRRLELVSPMWGTSVTAKFAFAASTAGKVLVITQSNQGGTSDGLFVMDL